MVGLTRKRCQLTRELKRRLGFEYNGMVLHEYYFSNLKKDGGGKHPPRNLAFRQAVESSFGSFDFSGKQTSSALARCAESDGRFATWYSLHGQLSNHWVTLH